MPTVTIATTNSITVGALDAANASSAASRAWVTWLPCHHCTLPLSAVCVSVSCHLVFTDAIVKLPSCTV